MNIKKMSLFVIALGLIISLYGVITLMQIRNYKPKFDSSFSLRAFEKNFNTIDKALSLRQKKEKAVKYCIAGGVILFLGVGLLLSANKSINEGEKIIERKIEPTHLKIEKQKIVTLIKGGQLHLALDSADTLLSKRINCSDFELYRIKGIILFKMGKKQQAKKMFIHAAELGDSQSKGILDKYFA